MGNLCGAGLINGHELAHRREGILKVAGTLCFSKMIHSHFYIEHLFGHHMNMATELDPATAKRNEWLQKFIVKSVVFGFIDSWRIENSWFHRRNRSAIHFSNRMIWFTTLHTLHLWWIYNFLGRETFLYHLGYSGWSIFLLETVNYIRHYGLVRMKDEKGCYEKINFTHSWNAPQRFTNYLMFKLQRHSDHHYDSSRPYQILRSFNESPVMPHGYSVSVILAIFPPLWFTIMDPYLDSLQKKEDLKPGVQTKVKTLIVGFLIILFGGLTFCMVFV